jgi:hypothetical protein
MMELSTIDPTALAHVTGGEARDTETWPGLVGRGIGCYAGTDTWKEFGGCMLSGELPKKKR